MGNGSGPDGIPAELPRPGGLVLAPFRALRYDPAVVELPSVLAPPYDVIDDRQLTELEARSAHNAARLTLPRDDVDAGSRYGVAARLLAQWREGGVLRPDPQPAIYVYEQTAEGHVQRGLIGALGLTRPEEGVVLPHENTMAGPVADRLALMEAVEGDLEPIFLVYEGGGAASQLVAGADTSSAALDVETPDGVRHRLWTVTDPGTLAAVADDLYPRRSVIADGHHRYATFLRYQEQRWSAGAGAGPWDLGLAFLVDGSTFGPQVHAIHRVVPGLPVQRAAELAERGFGVRPVSGLEEALDALAKAGVEGPAFALSDGSAHWLLTDPDRAALEASMPAERSAAWRNLDVTVAHMFLIRALWGLEDNEEVVDFRHDVDAAVAAAHSAGGTALLLNPTPVADVAAVAAEGERMPRKSTLFVPKPATGIVIRAFADA